MLKHSLESALRGELENHLSESKVNQVKNRKNGITSKRNKSNAGSFELETPRDRDGSFSPEIVPKRQLVLTYTLERQILSSPYGLRDTIVRFVKLLNLKTQFSEHSPQNKSSYYRDKIVLEPIRYLT